MFYRSKEMGTQSPARRVRLLEAAILVVLLSGGVGAVYKRDAILRNVNQVFASTDMDPIPTQQLERVAYQLEVPAIGEITGLESTSVSTPATRAGGLKIAWLVPEGNFVRAGDTVIRYDSTEARLNLERQENTLEANKERTSVTVGKQETDTKVLVIDRTDAEKEYEYAITVMPQDETIFSKWDIIEAKINADYAKDRIDFLNNKARVQKRIARADQQILAIERNKAVAEMGIAQETLDSLEVQSPRDGLVVYRKVRLKEPQVGDESWPGEALLEVINLEALQARIYVLERDAGSLRADKPVVIRLDAIPGKQFHGVVRSVSALAQPLTRNSPLKYFTCEVTIRDAGDYIKRIKPGMSLKADIVLEKYDSCFVVPASALTLKGADQLVYVKSGDSFVPRQVAVGVAGHGQATLLDGVQPNEVIAMRNPFETRKAYLPDFSKAGSGDQQNFTIQGGGGRGGGMRIMIH